MAEKKTKQPTEPTEPDSIESSAAEELERELDDEELLAELPELRPPHRLRLRHRNRIMAAFFKAERQGLINNDDEGDEDDITKLEPMLELLADVDDFAEAIAIDKAAYTQWAEANSDNYPAFLALMRRYVEAVGESNGSSS